MKPTIEKNYIDLPSRLFTILAPRQTTKPELVLLNKELAEELNLDPSFLKSTEGISLLSGSSNQFGRFYAQAYAGHQYGHFTILGDGRALNLGDVINKNGTLIELQLKGSGRTPYSRQGDGKATLYSMLREYIISEAIHALGIPTTRMLSVLKTNEYIQRQSLEMGSILCRSASSHLRVGTFEYASYIGGKELVKELADYAINRHYSYIKDEPNQYQTFFAEVIKNQAKLLAKWQSVGFVHGVMNTDNMTISGETIDYGPCAFMDTYDPKTVFSSIDQNGRYAYKNQPYIASWNLSKLAETLLPLFSDDVHEAITIANKELRTFEQLFITEYYTVMAKKIGIIDPTEEEKKLIDSLLSMMQTYKADFTNTFRLLTLDEYSSLPFYDTKEWNLWFQSWTRFLGTRHLSVKQRLSIMEQHNPVIIPRNNLVEEALVDASRKNDYTLFQSLLRTLKDPYNYTLVHDSRFIQPQPLTTPFVTYCGT